MENESLRGQLLIASPTMLDPNFFRTVILVLNHDHDGALGVVLNRPGEIETSDPLPSWSLISVPPAVVFTGGPVSPESGIGIAKCTKAAERHGFAPVFGNLGTVDLTQSPDDLDVEMVRVFSGYAGWTSGQLEMEIADGAWFSVPALSEDAFSRDPDLLWRQVLKRQAPELAMFAHCPPNPSMN